MLVDLAVDRSFVIDVLVRSTIAAASEFATNAVLTHGLTLIALLLALPTGVTT